MGLKYGNSLLLCMYIIQHHYLKTVYILSQYQIVKGEKYVLNHIFKL